VNFGFAREGEGGRGGVGFKQAIRRLGRETRGFGRVRSEVPLGWIGLDGPAFVTGKSIELRGQIVSSRWAGVGIHLLMVAARLGQ